MRKIVNWLLLIVSAVALGCSDAGEDIVDHDPYTHIDDFSLLYKVNGDELLFQEEAFHILPSITNDRGYIIILTADDFSITNIDGDVVEDIDLAVESDYSLSVSEGHTLLAEESPYVATFNYTLLMDGGTKASYEGNFSFSVVDKTTLDPNEVIYERDSATWYTQNSSGETIDGIESSTPSIYTYGVSLDENIDNYSFSIKEEYAALSIDSDSGVISYNSDYTFPNEETSITLNPTIVVTNRNSGWSGEFANVITITIIEGKEVAPASLSYSSLAITLYVKALNDGWSSSTATSDSGSAIVWSSADDIITANYEFELKDNNDKLTIDSKSGVISINESYSSDESESVSPTIIARSITSGTETEFSDVITIAINNKIFPNKVYSTEEGYYLYDLSTNSRLTFLNLEYNGTSLDINSGDSFELVTVIVDNPDTEQDESSCLVGYNSGKINNKNSLLQAGWVLEPILTIRSECDNAWTKNFSDVIKIAVVADATPTIVYETDPVIWNEEDSNVVAAPTITIGSDIVTTTTNPEYYFTLEDNPNTEYDESAIFEIASDGSIALNSESSAIVYNGEYQPIVKFRAYKGVEAYEDYTTECIIPTITLAGYNDVVYGSVILEYDSCNFWAHIAEQTTGAATSFKIDDVVSDLSDYTISLSGDNSEGLFSIDTETGAITKNGYLAVGDYNLVVTFVDNLNSKSKADVTIKVNEPTISVVYGEVTENPLSMTVGSTKSYAITTFTINEDTVDGALNQTASDGYTYKAAGNSFKAAQYPDGAAPSDDFTQFTNNATGKVNLNEGNTITGDYTNITIEVYNGTGWRAKAAVNFDIKVVDDVVTPQVLKLTYDKATLYTAYESEQVMTPQSLLVDNVDSALSDYTFTLTSGNESNYFSVSSDGKITLSENSQIPVGIYTLVLESTNTTTGAKGEATVSITIEAAITPDVLVLSYETGATTFYAHLENGQSTGQPTSFTVNSASGDLDDYAISITSGNEDGYFTISTDGTISQVEDKLIPTGVYELTLTLNKDNTDYYTDVTIEVVNPTIIITYDTPQTIMLGDKGTYVNVASYSINGTSNTAKLNTEASDGYTYSSSAVALNATNYPTGAVEGEQFYVNKTGRINLKAECEVAGTYSGFSLTISNGTEWTQSVSIDLTIEVVAAD